jgi:mRNA interferase RelE/StbE
VVLNKKWSLVFSDKAKRQIKKLDKVIQVKIFQHFEKILHSPNPRVNGYQLQGTLKSYWRYRVGDYRVLCQLKDEIITVSVVHVGHRRDVYKTIH